MPRPIPDKRTTREADATRDLTNNKPFRPKKLKELARAGAFKKGGTWVSYAPRYNHQPRKKEAA